MSKKNVKSPQMKYEVKDWQHIQRAIALVLSRLPDEPRNLRYIRHLSRLQVVLQNKGNGTHKFTSKQISSMTFALESGISTPDEAKVENVKETQEEA